MERTVAIEDGHIRELANEQSWKLFDRRPGTTWT